MITVIMMNNSYYNSWFSSGCWGSYGDWGIGVIMVIGMIMIIEDSYTWSESCSSVMEAEDKRVG